MKQILKGRESFLYFRVTRKSILGAFPKILEAEREENSFWHTHTVHLYN